MSASLIDKVLDSSYFLSMLSHLTHWMVLVCFFSSFAIVGGCDSSGTVSDPDLCEGVECSGHGACEIEAGVASCACDPGYEADGLACLLACMDGDGDGRGENCEAGPDCDDSDSSVWEDCDDTPPSVPTGLDAEVISHERIDLSWEVASDDVGVTGYRVRIDSVVAGTSLVPSFSVTGLTAQTIYGFSISALDAAGNESAFSAEVQATTLAAPAEVVPHGLTELFARKARSVGADYAVAELEDSANHFHWQPETVMFVDPQTGHETWRMCQTPGLSSYYHNDIGLSPWSADGRRMAFASRRPTNAFVSDWWLWMIVDTSGANLRTTIDAANRVADSRNAYFHWSPQAPDLYYEIGTGAASPQNSPEELFVTTVDDTGVSTQLLLTYPEAVKLDKMISADGRKLLVSSYDESWVYPTSVVPSSSINVPAGYSIDRDLALYGTTPTEYATAHDRYYAGDGSWYFIMPIGGSNRAWWRMRSAGSAADGGALCDNADFPVTDPDYDFGECWPDNADDGDHPDPFGSGYWSHFVPDRWGRHALHSCCCLDVCWADPGIGPGVWDIQNQVYTVPTFGGGASHHDWKGFSDWTVSSGSTGEAIDQVVYTQKYDEPTSQIKVVRTFRGYDGGDDYQVMVRPGQSPDGTKVAWHGEMLNAGSNAADIFWSVTQYPSPPSDLAAESALGGGVELNWLPPRYTERGWPYAGTSPVLDARGWPSLDAEGRELGEPLFARELRRYHVWRSPNGYDGWQEVGQVEAEYAVTHAQDPDLYFLAPVFGGARVGTGNPISFVDQPGDGTFHYAITSEEHSGLESRQLSAVLEVLLTGGEVTGQQLSSAAGIRGFWVTPPVAPTGLTVSPGASAGHYRLDWTESTDDKVRFYNVYYAETNAPEINQAHRMASLVVGTSGYYDWLGSSTGAHYALTAVDRQGNESLPIFATP